MGSRRAALLAAVVVLLGGADAYPPFTVPPAGVTVEQAWPRPDGLPALPARLGVGASALREAIAGWDIDVRGDGTGLPPGRGTVAEGEALYVAHCAACHGDLGGGPGALPGADGRAGQPGR